MLGPSTGVDNLSYNRGGHGNLLIKLLGMDQAEKLKARGNEMVARGKLDGAIEAYTEAITLEPGQESSRVCWITVTMNSLFSCSCSC